MVVTSTFAVALPRSMLYVLTSSAAHLADMSLMADILLIILRSSASLLLF
jgi:hypothetical protein